MKAQYCDECKYRGYRGDADELFACKKGHHPRFYKPVGNSRMCSDWGWKRRCNDFVIGAHVRYLPLATVITSAKEHKA